MGIQGAHEQQEERQGLGLHAEVPGAVILPETTHPHLRTTLTAAKQPQPRPLLLRLV